MIVSHRHKLIFIKTKKTAGTSFEIALSKFLDDDDIVTPIVEPEDERKREELGFKGPRNFIMSADETRNGKKVRFFNHIGAQPLRRALPAKMWSYDKVSILREPHDCIVSWYHYATRNRSPKPEFDEFLFANPDIIVDNYNHVKVRGKCVLDHIIRFSDFKGSILALEAQKPGLQGLWETFSEVKAKGNIRPKNAATPAEIFARYPKAKQLVDLLLEDEPLARIY